MKKIIEKWFCKHKWKTHTKVEVVIGKAEYNPQTGMHEANPCFDKEITREVLFCEHCGKIKQIQY